MSGKGGSGHFIAMRFTSAALALLSVWFVIAIAAGLPDAGYGSVIAFMARPFNAAGAALLVIMSLAHMSLGMEDVIADYIRKPSTNALLRWSNLIVPAGLCVLALYAIWRISFGA